MKKTIMFLVAMAVFAGCTTTQKAATTGGFAGATIGGIIGHQSGDGLTGAAIGGAVGTIGGMIVGDRLEKKFCPVCGAIYPEDVIYCPKDGAELKYRER